MPTWASRLGRVPAASRARSGTGTGTEWSGRAA